MTLRSFIAMPEVAARLKVLRPKTRRLGLETKALPRTKRYAMLGTAFDYMLRFELQRRATHAITWPWAAEAVPDLIWKKTKTGAIGIDVLAGGMFAGGIDPETV